MCWEVLNNPFVIAATSGDTGGEGWGRVMDGVGGGLTGVEHGSTETEMQIEILGMVREAKDKGLHRRK